MIRWWLIILLTVLAAGLTYGQVNAQTATPEPSPTPSYQQVVPMSTGSDLLITKSVSYGEIAVVTAVLLLVAVELVKAMVTIPHRWMKK